MPILRKSFELADKPVAKARLFATALGLYELRINGQRVGDHVLAPDWTDYRKRVRYQVYDVASLLKRGENAVAALLANGWYCGHIGNGGFQVYGKVPALLAQLEVTYADGSVERIVSDATWKVHASPDARHRFHAWRVLRRPAGGPRLGPAGPGRQPLAGGRGLATSRRGCWKAR